MSGFYSYQSKTWIYTKDSSLLPINLIICVKMGYDNSFLPHKGVLRMYGFYEVLTYFNNEESKGKR